MTPPWPRHDGAPWEPEAAFFAAPPPQLGEVLSAGTTFRSDSKAEHGLGGRALAFVLGASVGMLPGVFVSVAFAAIRQTRHWDSTTAVGVGMAVCCIPLGILAALWDSPLYRNTFLGVRGVAEYLRRRKHVTETVVLFEDVEDLRRRRVWNRRGGVDVGSDLTHDWVDTAGQVVLRQQAHFSSEGVPVRPEWARYLAASAALWDQHKVARVLRRLEQGKPVEFRLGGERFLRIRDGAVEVQLNREDIEDFPAAEVAAVRLKKGGHVLEIERPGAQRGVLWSDGILTLDVTDLGDRAIFAGVLAAAVGVEVEVVP